MLQDIRSETLSRRSFLVGAGAACVAVAFGSLPDTALAAGPLTPNAWVTIGEDGIVTIVPPAVEMGQGAQTSLPLILAEELDADWSKVRLAQLRTTTRSTAIPPSATSSPPSAALR